MKVIVITILMWDAYYRFRDVVLITTRQSSPFIETIQSRAYTTVKANLHLIKR